jgi:hypothetical protein
MGFQDFMLGDSMATPPRGKKPSSFDASMITTTALPSTGAAVAAVLAGSGGAEYILQHIAHISAFENAVIVFSALLSFIATFVAPQLSLVSRVALWPLNFCILVYLVFASATTINSIRYQDNGGSRITTYAIDRTIAPANTQ